MTKTRNKFFKFIIIKNSEFFKYIWSIFGKKQNIYLVESGLHHPLRGLEKYLKKEKNMNFITQVISDYSEFCEFNFLERDGVL